MIMRQGQERFRKSKGGREGGRAYLVDRGLPHA